MTRRNPERPPGPSYYRLPEASWTMIRDEYLSGWTAKEIGAKWRVSPTSVYRHASDGGWNKYARGQAFHDQIVAEAAAGEREAWPREEWTSLKDPVPPSLRRWPHPLPGMGPMRRPQWEPPAGYGPMPPELVPPVPRPPEPPADEADAPTAAEAAEQAVAAAARAVAAGRYEEAERLGRLAVTLQKLAGAAPAATKAKGEGAFHSVEDEDDEAALPFGQQPLSCTPDTCRLQALRDAAEARIEFVIGTRLKQDDLDDITAWTDMMDGLGATVEDEDLRRLAAMLKTKGPGPYHRLIDRVLDRPSNAYGIENRPAP
jgi:hypothetical protein